ncbi:MAG: sterol desaturase family protein [Myxococcota bacterium]
MRAIKASADGESQRMFDNDLFEFFSRIPPWQPPAIYLPVIGYTAYVGLFERGIALLPFLGLVLAGITTWSLLEYWLHRLVFHYEPRSAIGKRLFWYLHGVHHDWPNDKMRLVFPPAVSIPLALLFWTIFGALLGESLRYPMMSGLAIGYLSYDMIHYWVHHFSPRSKVGKFLRRYHLEHHFKNPQSGYGVSSPIWDYVFQTTPDGSKKPH